MNEPLSIQPTGQPRTPEEIASKAASTKNPDSPSFSELLKNSILEVNQLQKQADEAVQDLVEGKTENFTGVLTAVEKADLAFRALMQIRNKLVDAYEEINRLRV